MPYCVTPGCFQPQNPEGAKFCLSCGAKLLLKDRYRPIKPIGKGGFGITFLAVDEDIPSKPRCVIKQLHLVGSSSLIQKKATQLFNQEAQRLDELGQHSQIPTLLAHFEQQKRLFLVQEYIEGQTLAQELRQAAFNESQIWELLTDLLPVLKYIHDRKVIHRDIKPANIMRRLDGKLVLIDFGVAKLITDSALFRTGTTVGSAEYMSPEQTKGKTLPASDLYSLGVTCIHLFTGVPPFDLFDITNNRWAWRDYLPAQMQVSPSLGRILDKLLQPAVSQRYQSAAEVLQTLTTKPTLVKPLPQPQQVHFLNSLWRQYNAKPQADILNSTVRVDYTKLQHLLAARKWQQADAETWRVMCEALDKPQRSYLQRSDIDRFPCEDFLTINRLWEKYSQGRFGLGVQIKIYHSCEQDFGQFCHAVGWIPYKPFSSYLKFTTSAPIGHLPSWSWAGGGQLWRIAQTLASKLETC
jgi:serine/threonine protein kinase